MSVVGGKYKALERGKEINCEAIQLFLRNVRSWNSGPIEQKELEMFIEKRKVVEIWPIISHDSYLINLASIDPEKLEKYKKLVLSYPKIVSEMRPLPGIIGPHMVGRKDQTILERLITSVLYWQYASPQGDLRLFRRSVSGVLTTSGSW